MVFNYYRKISDKLRGTKIYCDIYEKVNIDFGYIKQKIYKQKSCKLFILDISTCPLSEIYLNKKYLSESKAHGVFGCFKNF